MPDESWLVCFPPGYENRHVRRAKAPSRAVRWRCPSATRQRPYSWGEVVLCVDGVPVCDAERVTLDARGFEEVTVLGRARIADFPLRQDQLDIIRAETDGMVAS